MQSPKRIAVIGAGAAGLATAREILRHGMQVVVLEQSQGVGGTWLYEPDTEDDLMGVDTSRHVHSSLYDSLRTNLPRDLMAFLDYSFDSKGGGDDYDLRYPHHSSVLTYLERFAAEFDLLPHIAFGQSVTSIKRRNDLALDVKTPELSGCWSVTTLSASGEVRQEDFDAVAVCNGHYSKTRVPVIDGQFEGMTLHSHNYRNPEFCRDKTVVVLGAGASGSDISREIAQVAKRVVWCAQSFTLPITKTPAGVELHPWPKHFHGQGPVFDDDQLIDADIVMYCTGYEYQFPFLGGDVNEINNVDKAPTEVVVDDNWVHPLYMDIVSPTQPTLGFIGLPFLVIPFPLFQIQAEWFAKSLCGELVLPSPTLMLQSIDAKIDELTASDVKKRHFHRLAEKQTDYINLLASHYGRAPLPSWFGKLALYAQQSRMIDSEHFRDLPFEAKDCPGPTTVKLPKRHGQERAI
jgi:hypothetical protein